MPSKILSTLILRVCKSVTYVSLIQYAYADTSFRSPITLAQHLDFWESSTTQINLIHFTLKFPYGFPFVLHARSATTGSVFQIRSVRLANHLQWRGHGIQYWEVVSLHSLGLRGKRCLDKTYTGGAKQWLNGEKTWFCKTKHTTADGAEYYRNSLGDSSLFQYECSPWNGKSIRGNVCMKFTGTWLFLTFKPEHYRPRLQRE